MNKKIVYLLTGVSACAFALTSCGGQPTPPGPDPEKPFDFSIALKSGKTTLEIESNDQILIQTNGIDDQDREYVYKTSNVNRATVSETGYVSAVGLGSVKFTVTETKSQLERTLTISISDVSKIANGGFNYSAASGEEAIAQRTEILGKLEKYAVESHLTGITLFENGGYVKYNKRLFIPANEYITGYGFGILSEGDILNDNIEEPNPALKRYYHSAQTSDPNKINAWNASGSQISDLSSYITATYWNTKMKSTKDAYEWYPQLAADEVDGKVNDRPIPVYDVENPLGLYKTWRIYVKTGENSGLKYRYSGSSAGFDNRDVKLEDYAFVYQLLLTGANKQSRGAEMAGDKTYGIKGAQAYFTRTKDMTDQATIDATWKSMTKTKADGTQDPAEFSKQDLGIMVGKDEKGSYLQLELLNEIDKFTAMYTLSSSLYSPVPRAFIEELASDHTVRNGITNYGVNSTGRSIVDNTISLGAYKLDTWNKDYIAFGQNETWVERTKYPERNKIKGIKITTYDAASQDSLFMYYNQGLLDSCGVPINNIKEEAAKDDTRVTKGDSTFKLNVNSCTQDRWNELFGPNGTISKKGGFTAEWDVKPWMSNSNFLDGLYWSIDRETFARNKGAQPSINYFADAYLSDPENGKSYNDSDAHKAAVSKWHSVRTIDGKKVDDYGYNYDKAVTCFKNAVNELLNQGAITLGKDKDHPYEMEIHISWMYQTDITDYGNDIATFFTKAFNDDAVCNGLVKLVVTQSFSTNWEDVYNEVMMKGQFDLAFGAISGNTYNPLNFMEVLKSDNSSGFTLNWGADSSKVDEKNPLVFDGNRWSYDALWEVSDHGGVVENGVTVKTCKQYYLDGNIKDLNGNNTDDLSAGAKFDVALDFVDVNDVEININKVQIYTVGSANTDITYSYDKATKKLHCEIPADKAKALADEMVELNNKGKNPGDPNYISDPFKRVYYYSFWSVEVYYTLSIKKGTPSQLFVTVAKTAEDQDA